jgi:hypothetical protein
VIHCVLQHHLVDDFLLRNAEFLGLLGNLLVNQRSPDEAGADHIGTHAVLGPFPRQTEQSMLGGDIRCLELELPNLLSGLPFVVTIRTSCFSATERLLSRYCRRLFSANYRQTDTTPSDRL